MATLTYVYADSTAVLGLLALAVHAQVPVATLTTMHYAFPTLHRALLEALLAYSVQKEQGDAAEIGWLPRDLRA